MTGGIKPDLIITVVVQDTYVANRLNPGRISKWSNNGAMYSEISVRMWCCYFLLFMLIQHRKCFILKIKNLPDGYLH